MDFALQIIMGLLLFGGLLFWLLYVIEAFRQNLGQGLLTLFIPLYVFYFMLVRSKSSAGRAGMLAAMTIAYFAVAAIHELSQYR